MKEIWKDVINYEGLYQVSNLGNARRIRKIGLRNLKPRLGTTGYYIVSLSKKGIVKMQKVHRLVALAFIEKIPEYNVVNHLDGNKKNNNVNNLEWCNKSINERHAYKIGLKKGACCGKFGKDAFASKPVLQLDLEGNVIAEYPSMKIAAKEVGMVQSGISNVLSGYSKTCAGYKWKLKFGTQPNGR